MITYIDYSVYSVNCRLVAQLLWTVPFQHFWDSAIIIHTFVMARHLAVVSRTGRTEYYLLLMKASDRGRNVKF